MTNIIEFLKDVEVEWKEIGKISEIRVMTPPKKIAKKSYKEHGEFPIIDQGQEFIIGYTDDESAIFPIDKYVVFGDHTEIVKYIDFTFAQGADGIKVIATDENRINSRYLYHAILNFYEKSGKYARHFSKLKITKIPIPPLKTQEKIVEILDKFTDYVSELTAELTAELMLRQKQYSYFREQLLSENYLNSLKLESDNVLTLTTLGEVAKIKNGRDWKKLGSGGIPVYGSGGIMTYVDAFSYDKPSVLIPRKGSIENIFYVDKPFWNVDTIFHTEIFEDKILPKYLYYFMQQFDLKTLSTDSTRPSLTQTVLNKIELPLPSISIQSKVVQILDKFQDFIGDVTGLLPEEIEQRRKQYEYYREKLLTFDDNMVSQPASQPAVNS